MHLIGRSMMLALPGPALPPSSTCPWALCCPRLAELGSGQPGPALPPPRLALACPALLFPALRRAGSWGWLPWAALGCAGLRWAALCAVLVCAGLRWAEADWLLPPGRSLSQAGR